MEAMVVRLLSAARTDDGRIRARARVQSVKHDAGRPELSMFVMLDLAPDDGSDLRRSAAEIAYDRILAYLDIA